MSQNNGEPGVNSNDAVPPPYTSNQAGPPPVVITQPEVTQPGVTYQSNMVIGNRMGPKPAPATCPSCNQQIVSRVELKSNTKTHLIAVLLCCVCCPCAFLPYCIDSCHNADHYCPKCNAYLGTYAN